MRIMIRLQLLHYYRSLKYRLGWRNDFGLKKFYETWYKDKDELK